MTTEPTKAVAIYVAAQLDKVAQCTRSTPVESDACRGLEMHHFDATIAGRVYRIRVSDITPTNDGG